MFAIILGILTSIVLLVLIPSSLWKLIGAYKLDQIGIDWIRLDQVGSDDLGMT